MNKYFRKSASGAFAATCLLFLFLLLPAKPASAALNSARVTQVIRDVKLVPSNATPRPAAINDDVREGTAVRTGQDSRTELTFTDKTLTRLGANSVFSFNIGAGTFDLGQGSILMQVPPNGSSVKVRTAAVTAAITGGTAIFGTGPPTKFMVLEGTGTFYPAGHPEEAVTLHGGEMVTLTPDGHLVGPAKFDVKTVLATSELITSFPDLANLPLILEVIREEEAGFAAESSTPPPKNSTDVVDQKSDASTPSPSPSASPTGTPGKFGPPTTITSPDPYVINSGTQIQTDPSITTNGVTNFGKIWRGQATDGPLSAFIFGSTSTFDTTSGFDAQLQGNSGGGAGFKFSSLQLTGNPTVSTTNGEINLGLIGVNGVTSGGPGGILTFAGIRGLLIATQNGSIDLGPEISFAGLHDINLYARGAGSNLIIGSAISTSSEIHLFSQGNIQISGVLTTNDFTAFSGGDFLAPTAPITAANIDIQSLSNVNIDASEFPNPTGTVNFNAASTLSITHIGGGTFTGASLTGYGTTINLQGSGSPTTFDLGSAGVSFVAGSGGIQAPNVLFTNGSSLVLQTTNGGDINIYGFESPSNGLGGNVSNGMIDAAGAVNATTNITNTGDLTAGTSVSVGGDLGANNITAGTTIHVGGNIYADTLSAGGNIDALGVQVITINAPTSVLTVGSDGIDPVTRDGAALQHTFNVDSIVSTNGIDFSGNQFNGISGLSSGGKLTINSNTLTFDSEAGVAFANFNGADAGEFGESSPPNGGDGGIFIVNTSGNITANHGADITATTGLNSDAGVYSGAGGSVTLHSTGGMVTVNDTIQVSSDDSEAQRQSASGGTILLQSDLTTGSGITVGANGQLLSLLNANASGSGGSITLSTMGADITVNGTIEADFGTITLNQTDPPGLTPLITIDGATLISDTLNVYSMGDLNIAQTNLTTLTFSTATLHGANNVNWNVGNTFLPELVNEIDINGGNAINFSGGNSDTAAALNLTLQSNSTFTAGAGGINAPFIAFTNSGATLNFISAGSITAYSIIHSGNASGTIAANGGALTLAGDLTSGDVSALTNIDIGGNVIVSNLTATSGTITVGGSLGVFGAITAGSDISAETVEVSAGGITTPGNLTAGLGGIHPFIVSPGGATEQNFITANTVISPNGIDFSGNQFSGIDGHTSGGILTMNVSSANFDPTSGIGIVNFNGADAGATDFGGNVFTTVGGDGGTFIANATGDITVTSDSPISATTGQIDPNLSSVTSSGVGGTVELNSSTGTVSVDSTIQVSSAEPTSTIAPFRSSASGGNIKLTSGKTSGVAINVSSSTQLLSLLNAAAPGPGGKITILASASNNSGNNSTINIDNSNGLIAADGTGGTVDIEHNGDSGTISINNANIRADVVKVGAFGDNGTLNIGGGAINADTVLKLYAPGSNGQLNFIANVTLSSNTAATLAANTITIQPTVIVNIAGTGGPANIYTNNPNYNFTPGGGYTGPLGNPANGSFGGNGAHDPQPLPAAPTF